MAKGNGVNTLLSGSNKKTLTSQCCTDVIGHARAACPIEGEHRIKPAMKLSR